MEYSEQVINIQNSGYRMTESRLKIIKLLNNKVEGFTVDFIYKSLPEISRATVFRTLKFLLKQDLICKLVSNDRSTIYTISKLQHHHHTICVKCNSIGEFNDNTVEKILQSIQNNIEGIIVEHNLQLHIICSNCANFKD
tara:strand:- start:394 stop:810 length:417 start_codon:yes stop_codon:yes gene_type:complete